MESFFENLYNNDLVDEDAFNAWAADTTDADGKARALAQLTNWFNLLAEAQTEGIGSSSFVRPVVWALLECRGDVQVKR